MTRPHEDLERHTPTDHRSGGVPVTFASGTWCAIEIAHVKADRVDAGISTYETLIEKARTSTVQARGAAILRSVNDRQVIALIGINGHDAFRHLKTAWDDHHLRAERHTVAESSALALYQVAANAGQATIDPASKDSYAFEHIARDPNHVGALTAGIGAAQGFRGVLVFGTDDASASAVVYRFEHADQLDTFRQSVTAQQILGPVRDTGETVSPVHPVKTFG